MSGPLDGVRIIDLTVAQQGPYATVMLGDMGADVIKVENPRLGGDPFRGMRRILGESVMAKNINSYVEAHNRNKRSICLDLHKQPGREVLYRLVEKSDVFVHNFHLDAEESLGMTYEEIARHNPRIVYAAASAYGPKGPDRNREGLDIAALAKGGLLSVVGEPDAPVRIPGGLADQVGAMVLAYGIMLGLFYRERTGIGQRIDTSLLGSTIALQSFNLLGYLISGRVPKRVSRREVSPLWNAYRTKDGQWLVLGLVRGLFWPRLCTALGMEELKDDPRFATGDKRIENATELISVLDKAFAQKTLKEWIPRLNEQELIFAPVQDFAQVAVDPQVLENEYIVDFDHPVAGPIKVVGIPVKMSKTPGSIRSPSPVVGQHTEEVLVEVGGYSWDEIALLKEEEVI